MMHVVSVLQISRRAEMSLSSDALASAFIEGMVGGLPEHISTENPLGTYHDEKAEPDDTETKKAQAITLLREGILQLTACIRRVVASDVPEKARLLAVLGEIKQGVQWLLKKWMPLDEYIAWLATNGVGAPSNGSCFGHPPLHGMFSHVMNEVDTYITQPSAVSIDMLEISLLRATLNNLMTTCVWADLTLRHDVVDYLEFCRHLRKPRVTQRRLSQNLPFHFDPFQ